MKHRTETLFGYVIHIRKRSPSFSHQISQRGFSMPPDPQLLIIIHFLEMHSEGEGKQVAIGQVVKFNRLQVSLQVSLYASRALGENLTYS
jgi:hypothetical protein